MAYQPIGQEILPITIAITSHEIAPRGGFTVTLANGQVWRSRKEHYDKPRFRDDGPNVVTIEHGLLGGFDLYVRGNPGAFKVERIQ